MTGRRGVDRLRHDCYSPHMLAYHIRKARRARKWKQSDLAQATGVHTVTISRIENEQHVPTLDTALRLIRALDLDLAEVMRDE